MPPSDIATKLEAIGEELQRQGDLSGAMQAFEKAARAKAISQGHASDGPVTWADLVEQTDGQ